MTLSTAIQQATVEQAEISDIAALIDIAEQRNLSHWSRRNYLDELARSDSIILSARLPEAGIVGFIVGRVYHSSADGPLMEAEIYNIGLYREFQGFGLGQRLFDGFLERCQNANVIKIWLEVRASNEMAIAFYVRNRFVKHSVRKGFYSHPTEDGIVMSLSIERPPSPAENST